MSPNFELIAHMLGDYHDLQADGIVDAANRFPLGAIEEQIALLSSLQPVSNTTLANRIAELERDVSMHRNAEITWEKTMMAAVGEDGPSDVIKAIDKIKAERDAALAQVEALQSRIGAAERVEAILSEAPELTFDDCKKLFADEIAEVKAQAGRDGFLYASDFNFDRMDDVEIDIAANDYADSILKGEVK